MHIFVHPVERAIQTNTGDPHKAEPPTSAPADDQEMHSGNSSRRPLSRLTNADRSPGAPAPRPSSSHHHGNGDASRADRFPSY